MEQKTNKGLSGYDSRIESPPKREWYGDASNAITYNELVEIYRYRVDSNIYCYAAIYLVLLGLAFALGLGYIYHITQNVWLCLCGAAAASGVCVAVIFCIVSIAARVKAMNVYCRMNPTIHIKIPKFKQTYKFGK